jgi:hypothetical protein
VQPAAKKEAKVARERAGRRGRARRRGKSTSPRQEQIAKERALAEEEHEQLAKERYVAKEEQLATQLPDEEQPTADKNQLVVEQEEPTAREKATQSDKLSGEVEQAVDDDQTVEMLAVVKPEPADIGEQQAPIDQEQAALQKQRSGDEFAVEDDATVQMAAVEEALAGNEFAIEDDATVQMAAVEEALAEEGAAFAESVEETQGANGWQLFFLENPLVHVLPSPEDDEVDWSWNLLEEPSSEQDSDSAVLPVDDKAELTGEPDEVPDSFVEIDPDTWALYIDIYPPVYLASTTGSEDDELNWNWDWEWDEEPAPSSQESNGHESNGNGHDQNEAQVSGKDQPTQAGHRSSRV